jgi:predicted NAD/FAD-binding protein
MRGAQRIAVVGAGISGLASAWLLARKHQVTLYEAGGKARWSHAHRRRDAGRRAPPGRYRFSGFQYADLCEPYGHVRSPRCRQRGDRDVIFGQPRGARLEWAGSSLATVFGQKRNLLRPDFWRMLADILRFNRESVAWTSAHPDDDRSLRDFLAAGGYSRPFAEWYLLPMAAAIWSCPAGQMLDYPLATFVRFCRNHGLLQVFDRPLWRTVKGGGREYVGKLAASLDDIRLATPVRQLRRTAAGVQLHTDMAVEHYDQVILACHSDQALAILGASASAAERRLLGAIRYAANRAVLHTDEALLPRSPALWSAWNYLASSQELDQRPGQCLVPDQPPAATAVQDTATGIAEPAACAAGRAGDCRIRLRTPDFRRCGDCRPA